MAEQSSASVPKVPMMPSLLLLKQQATELLVEHLHLSMDVDEDKYSMRSRYLTALHRCWHLSPYILVSNQYMHC